MLNLSGFLDEDKQQLIEKYLSIYNVNLSASFVGDVWELADSWVNTRQIHADHVPQLGVYILLPLCANRMLVRNCRNASLVRDLSSSACTGAVLRELSEAQILVADVGFKGTQLKLTLTLSGNRKASFKPKW